MYISKIDNTAFGAGKIKLKGIEPKDFGKHYKTLEMIANRANIDILVMKNKESRFLPTNDMYVAIASQEVATEPYVLHGAKTSILKKNLPHDEMGARLVETVARSVNTLGKKVEKFAGINPNYLSWTRDLKYL